MSFSMEAGDMKLQSDGQQLSLWTGIDTLQLLSAPQWADEMSANSMFVSSYGTVI